MCDQLDTFAAATPTSAIKKAKMANNILNKNVFVTDTAVSALRFLQT